MGWYTRPPGEKPVPVVDRITLNPDVMGSKPCIRGMRITVGTVLGLLAAGHSAEEILGAYPYLEKDDISAALASRMPNRS